MSMLTLVLVHGALLTSSAWMPVQNYLQNHGYNVVTLDVPGRAEDDVPAKAVSLEMSADKVCSVVNLQKDQVILVGHSQGGAVITLAANQCGAHIAGLVYIAAVVPANGEKVFDLLSNQDADNFEKVAKLDADAGVYQINYRGPIKAMFMADANSAQAQRAINNLVPEPARIGDDTLQYDSAAFAKIPKFYIKTSEDKIISPETQDKYISRTAFKQIIIMKSSHSPFVSQPKILGQYLADIYDSF